MTDSDTDLARRARDGDRPAFEELVRRTAAMVHARLYLETGDRDRAEDLTQDTFLAALRGIRSLDDPERFRGWLLRVAANTAADAARRSGRRKRSAPEADAAALETVADGRPAPAEQADLAERRSRVLAALRAMPEEYRLPLTLRHIAGADHAAIARQLGLTDGALRGLLHRGMKRLREELSRALGAEP
jgi:RNA polymerase sigma-70 factor (ECF subfamily)